MKREIEQAVEVLKSGGCILYPTDTIWGIGCDATDADAVSKIYKIKQREDSKAMLVLVDSVDMIWDYVEEIPEAALNILEVNDQPLTIIYPGAKTGGSFGSKTGAIPGAIPGADPLSRDWQTILLQGMEASVSGLPGSRFQRD